MESCIRFSAERKCNYWSYNSTDNICYCGSLVNNFVDPATEISYVTSGRTNCPYNWPAIQDYDGYNYSLQIAVANSSRWVEVNLFPMQLGADLRSIKNNTTFYLDAERVRSVSTFCQEPGPFNLSR